MGLGKRYPEIMAEQRRIAEKHITEIQVEQLAADAARNWPTGPALQLAPVGMDLHRRRSVLARMTETGEHLETVRILNDRDVLAEVMARAGQCPEVVLEWRSRAGGYLGVPKSADSWLAAAVRRCQKTDPTFPRITAHALRHTAASLGIPAGANPNVVWAREASPHTRSTPKPL
jgi:integrase